MFLLVAATPSGAVGAQELDPLEGDDYLDPRLLQALADRHIKSDFRTGWIRLGGAIAYQQRTESRTFNGYVTSVAGQYYRANYQLTVQGQLINDGWKSWEPGLGRGRLAAAVYLRSKNSTRALDAIPRLRASMLVERRASGIVDVGWSIDEDGHILIDQLPGGIATGFNLVRFESRGETTFLYFARYPLPTPSGLFDLNVGAQYGHTWFQGEHTGVEHDAIRLQAYGVFNVPFKGDTKHIRVTYSPTIFRDKGVTQSAMITFSGSMLFDLVPWRTAPNPRADASRAPVREWGAR
jgi:hypothetical protein